MARLAMLSDLHYEFWSSKEDRIMARRLQRDFGSCDFLVVAGDFGGVLGLNWVAETLPDIEIIAVVGNHDLYDRFWSDGYGDLEELSELVDNIHLLERKVKVIVRGGIAYRFLGTTLWTDYEFKGEVKRSLVMAACEADITDHAEIALDDGSPLTAEFLLEQHRLSRSWLEAQLARPFNGETIVVTHHAPSQRSTLGAYPDDFISAAFVSHLDQLVGFSGARLWIHGHTHHDVDYMIGDTRVLSRQLGYARLALPTYDPLILDLDPGGAAAGNSCETQVCDHCDERFPSNLIKRGPHPIKLDAEGDETPHDICWPCLQKLHDAV